MQAWFVLFFSAISFAGFTGGTVHGFFPDTRSSGYAVLWPATLLAVGTGALAGWGAGASMSFNSATAAWISRLAFVAYLFYAVVVLFVTSNFAVAIVHYLPAAVFLGIMFLLAYCRQGAPILLLGLLGLLFTVVAAGFQHARIGIHPRYLNYNALYHLIQGLALLLIFLAARWLIRPAATKPR